MNTDLQQIETALTEFKTVDAGIAALRERHANVVFEVATPAGMKAAIEARREIREPRLAVERIRKAAKAPILALGKTLDAEAARITKALEALEEPIDRQIKDEEDRKEREKQAKIAAEAARVQGIQDRIADIRAAVTAAPKDSAGILRTIEALSAVAIDESFAEFVEAAADAKAATLGRLRDFHDGALEREAEQARLAAEREELARLRRAEEERQAAERARMAEEERQARATREAAEAEERRLRREREQADAEARAQREAEDRARRQAEEAELQRQREAIEAERKAQQAEADRLAREREELAAKEAATAARVAEQKAAARRSASRPTDAEILKVIADHFQVSTTTASGWLASMRAVA